MNKLHKPNIEKQEKITITAEDILEEKVTEEELRKLPYFTKQKLFLTLLLRNWIISFSIIPILLYVSVIFTTSLNEYKYLFLTFIIFLLTTTIISFFENKKKVAKISSIMKSLKSEMREPTEDELNGEKVSAILSLIKEVAKNEGIRTPKFYILESEIPNAFTTHTDINNAIVVVGKKLLEEMTPKELQGVVAHEMSHIISNDVSVSGILRAPIDFIKWATLAFFVSWLSIYNVWNQNIVIEIILFILFFIPANILFSFINGYLSKRVEYRADRLWIKYVGKETMLQMLKALKEIARKSRTDKLTEKWNEASSNVDSSKYGDSQVVKEYLQSDKWEKNKKEIQDSIVQKQVERYLSYEGLAHSHPILDRRIKVIENL